MNDSESTPATPDEPVEGHHHEHPLLETFGAENVIEDPGTLENADEDPASDADFPAP